MSMARDSHGVRCEYGCCGVPPKQRFLGRHATQTKTAVKRVLVKRDRQSGKRECSGND